MELFKRTGLIFLVLVSININNSDANQGNTPRAKRDADSVTFTSKLRIVTVEMAPYMTMKQGSNGIEYTGFLPDLIYKMSQRLGFHYEFYPSPDKKWGNLDPDTGEWSGMMKELMVKQYGEDGNATSTGGADMAAAAFTITSVREKEIDFVKPFHNLGLTLVVKKDFLDKQNENNWPIDFSIFKPLSAAVWGVILVIVVVVGFLMALLNKFDPYEWGSRYDRGLATESEKEAFSISGSLWFVFTTLQWQGFDKAPRSISGKILTVFWFAFVTLTLISYTGALVNNLWWASMVQRHNPAKHFINGLEDIVSGNFQDFKVGCTAGGSTYKYVTEVAAPRFTEFNLLKKYWETPDGQSQLVSNMEEGLEKVRAGKYAFIAETMLARLWMNRSPCDVIAVGPQFGKRSYGLAVPKNSPYLEALHKIILELTEEGEVDVLEAKWWEGSGECPNMAQTGKTMASATDMIIREARPKAIDLNMYWGVILAMVCGVIISLLAAGAEILYFKYRGRMRESRGVQIQALPKLENQDTY